MKPTTKLAVAALGAAVGYGLYRRHKSRSIRGQTALITGSSRGLGYLMAREYARQGCRVVICSNNKEELSVAEQQLRQEGADVLAIPCDVSDREQVGQLVEAATRHFGGVDILVNNAGIIHVGPFETQTMEDFDEAMGVMFYGTLYPIWAVLPQMMKRGDGRIVNITSIGAKLSFPHLLPYNCAKYAARGLSEGLRAELGRHDISVTTVVPGLMRTGSYVNARYKGRRGGEFAWFSLGSSLPLVAINAERAARKIVAASRRREAEYVVGLPAKIGGLVAGLFPGFTADLLGKVDSLVLPSPDEDHRQAIHGKEVQQQLGKPAAGALKLGLLLGRRAGRRYNQ